MIDDLREVRRFGAARLLVRPFATWVRPSFTRVALGQPRVVVCGSGHLSYARAMYGAGHKQQLAGAVVLGSSFGGVQALKAVLPALPMSFPVPVIVVHHGRSRAPDLLPAILRACCQMPVDNIDAGYQLTAGRIAVAPLGGLCAISDTGVVSVAGPAAMPVATRNVDRALAAVAKRFASSAVAVILTGRLGDGASGVRAVKRAGGFVVVQDPGDAAAEGMPIAALASGCVDHRVPLRLIAPTLVAVTMAPGARELLRVRTAPWATASAAV